MSRYHGNIKSVLSVVWEIKTKSLTSFVMYIKFNLQHNLKHQEFKVPFLNIKVNYSPYKLKMKNESFIL